MTVAESAFLDRVAGKAHTQFLEYLAVNFTQKDSTVNLAASEFGKFLQSPAAVVVMDAQHGQSHQDLISMQTRVLSVKI